jgi:hypothetical protein
MATTIDIEKGILATLKGKVAIITGQSRAFDLRLAAASF